MNLRTWRSAADTSWNGRERVSCMMLHKVRCRETPESEAIPLERVIENLRENFLVFSRLKFTILPRWVGTDTPSSTDMTDAANETPKVHRSIFLTFEDDNEHSSARDLRVARLAYMGDKISIAYSAPKAEIVQCKSCWAVMIAGKKADHDKTEGKCIPNCKLCGDETHDHTEHYKHCRPCVEAGITNSYRCSHFVCPLCKSDGHDAEYEGCQAKLDFTASVESKVAQIQAGRDGGFRGGSRGQAHGRGRGGGTRGGNVASSSRGGRTVHF